MSKPLVWVLFLLVPCLSFSQISVPKFGKGIFNLTAVDSSFTMKIGLRFQNLASSSWDLDSEQSEAAPDLNFLIRRSRLKFDGYAFSPKLIYKFEMGLSNRDVSGGITSDFSDAPRLILDASVKYQFYKGWEILFGQGKLPGNRERVISSGNLQFVDRSRLNSRYNIDRDFGVQLIHTSTLGENFVLKEWFAVTQGEGRNISSGNKGGLGYTFRVEALPFGNFQSKGGYVGSAIKREAKPKLSVGVSYDINDRASKSRGQNGTFFEFTDDFQGRTLYTLFADMMFKYQNYSVMSEFASKRAEGDDPFVYSGDELVGSFYTGTGFNLQMGYMYNNNYEIAARYTTINPQTGVDDDENRYTIGLNKFIVGHKLKLQTDLTYRDRASSSDELIYRFQMDLHF